MLRKSVSLIPEVSRGAEASSEPCRAVLGMETTTTFLCPFGELAALRGAPVLAPRSAA